MSEKRFVPEGKGWERHFKFVDDRFRSPSEYGRKLDWSKPGTVHEVPDADPADWKQCASGLHGVHHIRHADIWGMVIGPRLIEIWVRSEDVICRSKGKCRYRRATVGSEVRDKRYRLRAFSRWRAELESSVEHDFWARVQYRWLRYALHWLRTGEWPWMFADEWTTTSTQPYFTVNLSATWSCTT